MSSMGGGGGGVEETEQQRADARVARSRYDYFEETFKPFENDYIAGVQKRNSEQSHVNLENEVRAGFDSEFSAINKANDSALAEGGFDPNSGKSMGVAIDTANQHGSSSADAVNRAQVELQDSYVGGLQNVTAIGEGQAATAQKGFGDIASDSARVASNKARNSLYSNNENQTLAGVAVGAGTQMLTGEDDERG